METGKTRTPFVLLSTQRSGSTWVIDTLNRLPHASVYGELLLPEKRTWDAGSLDFPRFIEADNSQARIPVRPFTLWAYLKKLYSKEGLVGFKLMYSAVREYPETLYYLYRHRIKVVHLVRVNFLNMIISSYIKAKTGQAHLQAPRDTDEIPQVHLPIETLLPRLRRLQKKAALMRKMVRVLGLPHMEITYESLLEDKTRFSEIYEFLEVTPGEQMPVSSLQRIRTTGHRATLLNYDEVRTQLRNSEFEHLLEK